MASPRAHTRPSPRTGQSAHADPLLWFGVVVWTVSILPSLVPIFSADFTCAYADQHSDAVPLLVVLLAALSDWQTPWWRLPSRNGEAKASM